MPSEIRHILFQDAEVGKAVRFYRERTGTVLAPGDSNGYTVENVGPGQDIRFSMQVGIGPQSQSVSASGSELAAALILYCRNQKIPLPAGAAKSLQCYGGKHLCLVVTRNSSGVELPPMPGPV